MSDNIYLVDLGLSEDTVIYELVPREVARLKGYSLQGVIETLKSYGARSLVVDAPEDRMIDELLAHGLAVASDLPVPLIVAEAKSNAVPFVEAMDSFHGQGTVVELIDIQGLKDVPGDGIDRLGTILGLLLAKMNQVIGTINESQSGEDNGKSS